MKYETTPNGSGEIGQTKWDMLMINQDESPSKEQGLRRGLLQNKLWKYYQDSLNGAEVDLEQLSSDYEEYRTIEQDDTALLQACDRYYGVLSREYPDIYPANERLSPNKIEQMIDPEVDNYIQEIVDDSRFDDIVEKCHSDGKDWYENYLEYASFLAEKLYGDNRTPVLVFDPNKRQGTSGQYEHKLECDGTVLGHIVLYRNPKYENFLDEPRNHDWDMEMIAHEMWHAKQAIVVRANPDDRKAELYGINFKFYISSEEAGLQDYLYTQQLVEREACYFGNKILSAIENN